MKIKLLLLCFMLAIFINCSDGGGSNTKKSNSSPVISVTTEPDSITDEETIIEPVVQQSTTIDDDEIPPIANEEKIKMGTLLYYDGSLKNYDGTTITKLFDCDNLIKAGEWYFIDLEIRNIDGSIKWSIPEKAIKACVYENILFYYTENNNLYYINADGISLKVANNPYTNHSVILTDSGIRFELAFFDDEAGVYDGQFVGYDNIMKIEKTTVYNKYWFDGTEFVKVGSGNYSEFVRWHSLEINGIVYYMNGATFDKEKMLLIEPSFNTVTKFFEGPSALTMFYQPDRIVNGVNLNVIGKPQLIGVGVIDGKGYFLNAKNGKLYIFNPVLNTVTEWLKIVEGVNTDDRVLSFELFDKVNAYVWGKNIIYFDGTEIKELNTDTGVIKVIATATYFKGYN